MTCNYEKHRKKENPRPKMWLVKDSFYLPVLNLPHFCPMFCRLWNEGEWNLVPHISNIARHLACGLL